MKAYFDRTTAFLLRDKPSFYATEVEVDEVVMQNIRSLQNLLDDMQKRILNSSSTVKNNQELADYFSAEVRKIFKTRKQENRRGAE